ncbi:hypothetical protein DPMN_157022 [Dreissena polymorpha]|uniref:Uncharacterized protein n=1 Tax=Dreissena polymorpha TaxID=45954 RepID=A0A9D4FQT7_DREPO|nr:hypothetical protein DPMN_157022 [Dreissena polymorpha]
MADEAISGKLYWPNGHAVQQRQKICWTGEHFTRLSGDVSEKQILVSGSTPETRSDVKSLTCLEKFLINFAEFLKASAVK